MHAAGDPCSPQPNTFAALKDDPAGRLCAVTTLSSAKRRVLVEGTASFGQAPYLQLAVVDYIGAAPSAVTDLQQVTSSIEQFRVFTKSDPAHTEAIAPARTLHYFVYLNKFSGRYNT